MSLRTRLVNLGAAGVVLGAAVFLGPTEAPVLKPYQDIGGVKTWCYGETLGIPKPSYTLEECDQSLIDATTRHWEGITRYVPQDAPLSVKEAMLSVAYNTGVGGWAWEKRGGKNVPSRFRESLLKGDWKGTCAAIIAPWQGAKGVAKGYKATVKGAPVRGLENRRAKEYKLCVRDLSPGA